MKTKRISAFGRIPVICFFAVVLLSAYKKPAELKNGMWRASIQRPDGQQIVFNFLSKDSAGRKILYIINGREHLLVDSIEITGDSVFIQLPFFESGFRAAVTPNGNLEGSWIKKYGDRVQVLPFKAEYNLNKRFQVTAPPVADLSGRWVAEFKGKNKISEIVGEFKQKGAYLTGTFLDPTGDYRFLEGVVSGDSLKLSTFDGANAYLFTAKIDDQHHISGGKFYSGAKGMEEWSAKKNSKAEVPDGFSETNIKPGPGKLNFTFPDSKDGSRVSINDEKYKNKVVVIQILGSWCPNCMDETAFLSDYYNQNHGKGLEIIGLAYERTPDFARSQKDLLPFKKRFHVRYPILVTGVTVSDPLLARKTLPQLKEINAFPTTVFIDKKGNIRKIDGGFSGPATGEHYIEFKKKFNALINVLLAEK